MSREVKFRAWDGEDMFYPDKGQAPYEIETYRQLNIPVAYVGDSADEHREYTLMQFTGLHDKNGKEIYEGDVLNWNSRKNTPVTWLSETGCWGADQNPLGLAAKMGEVIGNIYENPELLKQ